MNAMDALVRCRRAWELSQPQTFMDFDELEARQTPTLPCLEPVTAAHSPEVRGGLTTGAEPCRDHRELTAPRVSPPEGSSSAALAAPSAGSAPLSRRVAVDRRGGNAPVRSDAPDDLNKTGPDAIPPRERVRPRGGEV